MAEFVRVAAQWHNGAKYLDVSKIHHMEWSSNGERLFIHLTPGGEAWSTLSREEGKRLLTSMGLDPKEMFRD